MTRKFHVFTGGPVSLQLLTALLMLPVLIVGCHKDRSPASPSSAITTLAELTTLAVSNITDSSAECQGSFSLDGTLTITNRGMQWYTSANFPNRWLVSAGTGMAGFNNGDNSQATFSLPQGAATDLAGNIYIADGNNHAVRKITPNGTVSTLATLTGVANDEITDSAGNVYVAQADWKITKITPAGQVSTVAGSGIQGHVDATGTAAEFAAPVSMAIDPSGNLYVGDENNYRKISPGGAVTTLPNFFPGNTCVAIAVDQQYNIYECTGYEIARLDSSGNGTFLAGTGKTGFSNGTGAGAAFAFVNELRIDQNGNIIGSDASNNRIRVTTQAGVVTTLAGTGATGEQDGNSAIATFNAPIGLAITPSGDIVVPDAGGNKIRKISHL